MGKNGRAGALSKQEIHSNKFIATQFQSSMQALNHTERKQAFQRFVWVYALALLLPIVGVFLLARVPARALQRENDFYRTNVREETHLVARVDSLGNIMARIQQLDKELETTMGSGIAKGDYLARIQNAEGSMLQYLSQMRQDSAKLVAVNNRALSREVIGAYERFLSYRKTIADLRNQLAQSGQSLKVVDELKQQVKECQADLKMKQTQIETMLFQKSMSPGVTK